MKKVLKSSMALLLAVSMVFGNSPAVFATGEPGATPEPTIISTSWKQVGDEWKLYVTTQDSEGTVAVTEAAVTPSVEDPSCTEDGLKTWTPADEDVLEEAGTKEKVLPATGHTEGTPVDENVVPATCTTPATHDEVVYCTVEGCKAELSRVTVTDEEATGHTPAEEAVTDPETVKAATCTEDGSHDEVVSK